MSARNRCDICGMRDGFQNLSMIHCKTCNLEVHKECYGVNTYKKDSFECWACRAVGQSFQVEDYDDDGNRLEIVQEKRPKACALCSVTDGLHAMHPLYDIHGPRGRQVYLEDSEDKLVWVHSLCALFLTRKGFTFGCSRYGDYHGQESDSSVGDDDDDDDERSLNPELIDETLENSDYGEAAPIHHFIYRGGKYCDDNDKDIELIRLRMKKLKCFVCGSDDSSKDVFRIALQCDANAEHEFEDFIGKHRQLIKYETCASAIHVGCARWGGNNKHNVQRLYYYPGDEDRDAVGCIYCTVHGEDVDVKYQKRLKAMKDETYEIPPGILVSSLRQIMHEQKKSPKISYDLPRKRDANLELVSNDLIRTISRIGDIGLRQKAFRDKKKFWKQKLRDISVGGFTNMWKQARDELVQAIEQEERASEKKQNVAKTAVSRRSTPQFIRCQRSRVVSKGGFHHTYMAEKSKVMSNASSLRTSALQKRFIENDAMRVDVGSDQEIEFDDNIGFSEEEEYDGEEEITQGNLWSQLCSSRSHGCNVVNKNLLADPELPSLKKEAMINSPRFRRIKGSRVLLPICIAGGCVCHQQQEYRWDF